MSVNAFGFTLDCKDWRNTHVHAASTTAAANAVIQKWAAANQAIKPLALVARTAGTASGRMQHALQATTAVKDVAAAAPATLVPRRESVWWEQEPQQVPASLPTV